MKAVALRLMTLGVVLVLLAACSGGGDLISQQPTPVVIPVAESTVAPRFINPSGDMPPRPVFQKQVLTCEARGCNGADPQTTLCADESDTETVNFVEVNSGHLNLGELQLVRSTGRCGAVVWARMDKLPGPTIFAVRVVQCDTGMATSWREWDNRAAPAWSDMLSSPGHCAWAEYGIKDVRAPLGWRTIAKTAAR